MGGARSRDPGAVGRGGASTRWAGLRRVLTDQLHYTIRGAALGLHHLPGPGTRRPVRGGHRDAAMTPWGLPGSAALAAAVFVGGAVSSPLVAPGECMVGVGTPGAE